MHIITSTGATLFTTICDGNNIMFSCQNETKVGSKASNIEVNEA
jgi:hypothetical protein